MRVTRRSAGILLYRFSHDEPEFFLVHPGGPFWANKDIGAWTIPKGEFGEDEDALTAAIREFEEETGKKLSGNFLPLTPIVQKAGKEVNAWAIKGDIDPNNISSNSFKMEWPPKSGTWKSYPEVDKADWFDATTAKEKINPAQTNFIDELVSLLKKK